MSEKPKTMPVPSAEQINKSMKEIVHIIETGGPIPIRMPNLVSAPPICAGWATRAYMQ